VRGAFRGGTETNHDLIFSGTGYSKLGGLLYSFSPPCLLTVFTGFAGNDSPSFVFPTAIATKGPAAGSAAGSGSGRPAVANKPSFLTGGAGPSGHLSAKRGTEDLDFFIGDEALAASAGPGTFLRRMKQIALWRYAILQRYQMQCAEVLRIRSPLSYPAWSDRKLGMR